MAILTNKFVVDDQYNMRDRMCNRLMANPQGAEAKAHGQSHLTQNILSTLGSLIVCWRETVFFLTM